MKKNMKVIVCLVGALVVGVLVALWAFNGTKEDVSEGRKVQRVRASSVARTSARTKKVTEISLEEHDGKHSVRIVESSIAKPEIAVEDGDEDAMLTPKQRAALKELQAALDEDDVKGVRRALERMIKKTSSDGSLAGLPVSMRSRALEAIGWFGKETIVDLVPFLADADDDISDDAFDKLQMAGSECADDREKSVIIATLMRAVSDEKQIDDMLNNLNDMRNSVKVDTIISILNDGTDNARKVMLEQLGDYTDSDVSTIDDLKRWAVENQDEDDADEIYGS